MSAQDSVSTLGRANAFTFLTATKLVHWPKQLAGLHVAQAPEVRARLFGQQSRQMQLKTLNFLYTARWAVIPHFPRVDGQPRERRDLRWVLFSANFNGDSDTYVRAFIEAIPEGVYDLWGPAVGWPGFPAPETATKLLHWVQSQLVSSEHYYAAYPHASTNDVRAALAVRLGLKSVLADLAMMDAETASRWSEGLIDELVTRVQHCLGTVAAAPPGPRPAVVADGGIQGAVALFPIVSGSEPELGARLAQLPKGPNSPFAAVPGTHFARLAIIDRHSERPGLTEPLRNSYLMLAADFDTCRRDFYAAVFEQLRDASIWEFCRGVGQTCDPSAFVQLADKTFTCTLIGDYYDYKDQSLDTILRAIRIQQGFVESLRSHRRGEPFDIAALQDLVTAPIGP